MTKITETYSSELPAVENGVIRGAKLLGLTSRNGRRYEGAGLEKATALYEGLKVYVNHPRPEAAGADRSFKDFAGVIENVQYRKGKGLFGDVVLRQESDYFKGIVEVASSPKFRKSCGFSHVAEGESHYDGDTEIIESIKKVYSVDLVTDPATTAGIFESVQQTPEQVLTGCHTRLVEMMDAGFMGSDAGANNGEESPTDPMGQVISILKTAIAAIADMGKAVAQANKPAPAPAAPPVAPGKPDPSKDAASGEADSSEEDMSPEDKDKIAAFESLSRENAELKASKLLLESGREASAVRMKALANCAGEDEQRELLESWPKEEEASRPRRSPAAISESEMSFPRDNTEKFAALLR